MKRTNVATLSAIASGLAVAIGGGLDFIEREPKAFDTKANDLKKRLYLPHQGKREIARRAKQIERGILQVS